MEFELGDAKNLCVERNPFVAAAGIKPGVVGADRFASVKELNGGRSIRLRICGTDEEVNSANSSIVISRLLGIAGFCFILRL
jgi:hypothetical protein